MGIGIGWELDNGSNDAQIEHEKNAKFEFKNALVFKLILVDLFANCDRQM